jgi:ATP-binding cassette subfamily G (WHITE) protein 2 (SNQ2)
MLIVLSFPIVNQLLIPFFEMRRIYEIREGPSLMYSWCAFLTSHVLISTLWNIFASSSMTLVWYWTVGFPGSRAAYTFLVLGIIFPIFYTSFGLAVAAGSSDAQVASLVFALMQSFHMIL